jgi:hypothetical protein
MFDDLTDQYLSQEYDKFSANYTKVMNELKTVCTIDDKVKRKTLQKKSQILHTIMSQILKLRTALSDENNSNV